MSYLISAFSFLLEVVFSAAATLIVLRQRVTSPNGTTQAALESLTADHFAQTVAHAVAAATRRGAELAAALDDAS